jgi:isopentenyl-diphosphate delta-isomerase type 1
MNGHIDEQGSAAEQRDGGDELFDVVDECDQVIDQRARREVHALGLRHRAVHVFVFRPDGRMLIHLRSADKEEFPSVWTSSASGHVSAGESYDDAVPRELFEELGLKSELNRLNKFAACPDTSMEFTVLYSTVTSAEIVVDEGEIADISWQHPSTIAERIKEAPTEFSPAFRLLFNWYIQQ